MIDNKEVSNPSSIAVAFADYYSKLFSSNDSMEADDLISKCRSLIPLKLEANDISVLAKPISIDEIKGAIRALKDDKGHEPSRLPIEFYKVNIDWINKDLYELYNEALDIGSLSHDINKGILKLLSKEGDKYLIKNWRPITLLNVSYKILVKVLAIRLIHILPKLISNSQTDFIKGRYILKNLITAC